MKPVPAIAHVEFAAAVTLGPPTVAATSNMTNPATSTTIRTVPAKLFRMATIPSVLTAGDRHIGDGLSGR